MSGVVINKKSLGRSTSCVAYVWRVTNSVGIVFERRAMCFIYVMFSCVSDGGWSGEAGGVSRPGYACAAVPVGLERSGVHTLPLWVVVYGIEKKN